MYAKALGIDIGAAGVNSLTVNIESNVLDVVALPIHRQVRRLAFVKALVLELNVRYSQMSFRRIDVVVHRRSVTEIEQTFSLWTRKLNKTKKIIHKK